MKAVVIEEFGGPEVFKVVEIPEPKVKPGEVLVKVHASSMNPVDYKIRSGLIPAVSPDLPAILHCDLAGVVVEVGAGVEGFQLGDEVYAAPGGVKGQPGCLAEVVSVDAALLAKKPKSLSMNEAAALPLVSITAWEALFDRSNVTAGQQVLVHAAAGGVGHVALQLAKWKGAEVSVTGSSDEKLAIGKRLGADHLINYREESVDEYVARITGGKGFDVVFDTVGGAALDASFQAARAGGIVASIATRSQHDLTPLHQKGLSLHVILMLIPLVSGVGRENHGNILRQVSEIVDAGAVKPLLDPEVFPFDQVGAAHEKLEAGKAVGKIVLVNGVEG